MGGEDKELAQGRTNFQLEKFALLETHTLPVAFENTLKSRRQMAEGYMYKLIEMKQKFVSLNTSGQIKIVVNQSSGKKVVQWF